MSRERGKQNNAALRLTRRAPAKINLFLHITGRRADGYHILESLVAFTDIGDALTAEPAHALTLVIEGPFADALNRASGLEANLVIRAAASLRTGAKVTQGAALLLDKQLPVASGIGGGSSDAAATLVLLNALWALGLPDSALAEVGLGLGADVPVCIGGRAAFISGVGERVEPLAPLPPLNLVLVNPGVGLATPEVYRAFAANGAKAEAAARPSPKGPWADEAALIAALKAAGNDLEPSAISLCPKIAQALAALQAQADCALARMSGSGATCFGLFSARAHAERAARAIAGAEPVWWVKPARVLAPETTPRQ